MTISALRSAEDVPCGATHLKSRTKDVRRTLAKVLGEGPNILCALSRRLAQPEKSPEVLEDLASQEGREAEAFPSGPLRYWILNWMFLMKESGATGFEFLNLLCQTLKRGVRGMGRWGGL